MKADIILHMALGSTMSRLRMLGVIEKIRRGRRRPKALGRNSNGHKVGMCPIRVMGHEKLRLFLGHPLGIATTYMIRITKAITCMGARRTSSNPIRME